MRDRHELNICVHSCVCRYTHVWVHMHVEAGRHPWVFSLRSPSIWFYRRCLSLSWRSPNRLNWLASELHGTTDLCQHSPGIISMHYHTQLLNQDPGEQTQVFVCAKQVLSNRARLPTSRLEGFLSIHLKFKFYLAVCILICFI